MDGNEALIGLFAIISINLARLIPVHILVLRFRHTVLARQILTLLRID